MRKDRRLCRTCASYNLERYGYCVLTGKRVQGYIGGRPCWRRRAKKSQKGAIDVRLLASQIVDELMKRNDGSRKQCMRLMQVASSDSDPGGAGWGRQPMIDIIVRHLNANQGLITAATGGEGKP